MNMSHKKLPQDHVETLAFRVTTSRNDLGISKTELANRSGISRGHISKIEAGQITNLRRETIESLADALEIEPSYLLAFVEPREDYVEDEDAAERYMKQSPLVKQLMELFIHLPLRDQKLLVTIAKSIAAADQPRIIGEEVDGGSQR